MQHIFADIILPVPLPRLFTYEVPQDMIDILCVGARVVVPFGNKKFYSGVVFSIHDTAPTEYETKEIGTLLDEEPVVHLHQLEFWQWIADYYMCTLGEVYKAALPAGLKLESETKIHYNSDWVSDEKLSTKETQVLDFMQEHKVSSIEELNKQSDFKNILPTVKKLLNKEALFASERLKDGFKAKTQKRIALSPEFQKEQKLQNTFSDLSGAKRQLEVLMTFLTLIGGAHPNNFGKSITKEELRNKCDKNGTLIKQLIAKGILVETDEVISRLDQSEGANRALHPLNEAQSIAFAEIKKHFESKSTVLLHGVTSSGKTEMYIHLIQEQIEQGKQVLYLLPEIALTTQITQRLKDVFGAQLGVYHSKYSDAERVEIYNDVLQHKQFKVIVGVRSSIFLPFENLGLIIVDEEHENTYKQYDPAPRYHARDAALVLASMHKAKVLLGTATPSIESYFNAQHGKYGLVELFTRFEGIQMPEIITANVREERRKKRMHNHFSPQLVDNVKTALENGEQAILFQNRRGFSPYIECAQCAWVPKCDYCDVSMTYHKHNNQLICHYCGHSYFLPRTCKACESPSLETKGFGTEKIEEDIKLMLPEAKVVRMDLDTARTRKAHEKIINSFQDGDIDILIGTQMISKGLDFDKVSIVGILNADSMLNYPDFRAFERSYQLMSQVSGRAGRKNKRGLVVLQTANPDNPVIRDVINNNYKNHYQNELAEREEYKYPPFYRLISFTIRHKNQNICSQAADYFTNYLQSVFNDRIIGPQEPTISKIQNWFIQKSLLKLERTASLKRAKDLILQARVATLSHPVFKAASIQIDVDPM